MRNLGVDDHTVTVFLLSLVPPAGLVAAAFKRLRRAWVLTFGWLWLWLGFGVPLALQQLLLGKGWDALALAGQSLLAFLVAYLFIFIGFGVNEARLKSRSGGGILVVLVLLVAAGFVERRLSVFTWQNPTKTGLSATLKNWREDRTTAYGVRAWTVPAEAETLTLSFDARLLAGENVADWIRSDADFRVTPLQEGEEPFTRVVTPIGPDPYLMRTFDLGEPVGGRTFKVELELRAPQPVPAEGCRGVWLQVWYEGGDAKCLAVALDTDWRAFELTWTAPEAARSSVIRVILNNFDGLSYDVRRVKLYLGRQGTWQRLEPLIPQAASVQFGWQDDPPEAQSGTAFVPTRAWTPYSFPIRKPTSRENTFTATLHVGNDAVDRTALETRNTVLRSQTGALKPALVESRQSFLFEHPNFAGHTLVTLCLVLLSLTSVGWVGALAVALALFGVWLTGSRAAWLAALTGFSWHLWLAGGVQRRLWMLGGIPVLGALVVSGVGLKSLGRLRLIGVDEAVSRPEIWHVAWYALLEHPWTGIGADFPGYWRATYRGDSQEIVSHAHNFWLQFAALYGLPGLVAALWLTGGLLYLAWRWGRWRGLALVVPVFMMNVFDYTFFYSGVLFPLLLGMNALRQGGSRTQAKP